MTQDMAPLFRWSSRTRTHAANLHAHDGSIGGGGVKKMATRRRAPFAFVNGHILVCVCEWIDV